MQFEKLYCKIIGYKGSEKKPGEVTLATVATESLIDTISPDMPKTMKIMVKDIAEAFDQAIVKASLGPKDVEYRLALIDLNNAVKEHGIVEPDPRVTLQMRKVSEGATKEEEYQASIAFRLISRNQNFLDFFPKNLGHYCFVRLMPTALELSNG